MGMRSENGAFGRFVKGEAVGSEREVTGCGRK